MRRSPQIMRILGSFIWILALFIYIRFAQNITLPLWWHSTLSFVGYLALIYIGIIPTFLFIWPAQKKMKWRMDRMGLLLLLAGIGFLFLELKIFESGFGRHFSRIFSYICGFGGLFLFQFLLNRKNK